MSTTRARRGPFLFGRDIATLLALLLVAGVASGPAGTLLPVYLERERGWAPPLIAALVAARLLAAALSAPLGGSLADSIGPQRTLWIGLVAPALVAGLFLLSTAPALVLLVLVVGLADGLQATGSQAYLVARTARAALGRATGVFFVGTTLGGALGNLGASALLRSWGFTSLGVVGLGLGLLVLSGGVLLPADNVPAGAGRATGRGARIGYRTLLGTPTMRQLAVLRTFSTVAWGSTSFLWPLLLARLTGTPATAALFGTVSLGVAVAAQLGTGRLIDAIGPAWPAVILAALLPPLAVLSAVSIAADAPGALFGAGVATTAVAWALSGTIPPLVRVAAPNEQIGRALGLLHFLWALSMLTGTLLAGGLVAVTPALPFTMAALVGVPAAIAAEWLRRTLGQQRAH